MQSQIQHDGADAAPVVIDAPTSLPTKVEVRRARLEEQRIDAGRVRAEMANAVAERDAKTIRLRALRLAKEAADRDAAAAVPRKAASRVRKSVAR